MKALTQLERLQRINDLIIEESTGTPNEFADQLQISRRNLYEYINYIKDLGVAIRYSKQRETFYISNEYELCICCSVKIIAKNEAIKVNGGLIRNNLVRASFMHATNVI